MTPLQFEQLYEPDWSELEGLLDQVLGRAVGGVEKGQPVSGARLASLYRRTCEHLALSRARAYPAYLIDRLERLTGEAHQVIYRQHDLGLERLRALVTFEFPKAVRRHRSYVAVATATFAVPMIVIALLVYSRTDLILSVVSAETAAEMERMYSSHGHAIGRARDAGTDWVMFGYYIRNNVGIAFQCFAGGLFAGVGALFFLAYNGAFGGAVAGYLTARGLSPTFYSFVATHSSFELTAIVLAGAAGLRLGHSWLSPGRLTRRQSLVLAGQESVLLLYGAAGMLVIAAAVEAFWSSSAWVPAAVKYGVAAICWAGVIGYFVKQGRRAD